MSETQEKLVNIFDKFHIFTLEMEYLVDKTNQFISHEINNVKTYEDNINQYIKKHQDFLKNLSKDDFFGEFRIGSLIDIRDSNGFPFPRNQISKLLKDKKPFLFNYENTIQSWVMAWVYEQYEFFLKNVFIICKNDIDKDIDFLNKINVFKSPQYDLRKIHTYLTGNYSDIDKYEKNNNYIKKESKYNFYWYVFFIEKMRHIVVHKQGNLSNINNFKNMLMKDLGLSNNNILKNFLQQMTDFYFLENEDKTGYILNLSLFSNNKSVQTKNDTKKIKDIIETLVCHAFLITNCILSSFGTGKTH